MNFHSMMMRSVTLMCLVVIAKAAPVMAQNGSLFQRPLPQVVTVNQVDPRTALNMAPSTMETGTIVAPTTPSYPQLAAASWTYAVPSPPRVIRVHDVISIRIDEVARATAEGRATQRKNALYDAVLKDWLEFDGLGVRKTKQANGDPEVNGQLNQQYRATSDLQTRETLAFNIAGEIADIRPNGNIVLEGHKSITINDNRWEISISGMCQAKDISPDNVILSKDIIDLKIDKREAGQARDGYRRGWFTEWFSRLQPF